MDMIRKRVGQCKFIVLTDDPYYAHDIFGGMPDVEISRNAETVDLALMSMCDHGVVSASSFAWWGAFLARLRTGRPQEQIFFGPRHWAGFRSGSWHPEGFECDWIEYVDAGPEMLLRAP
jgi:hypothetical protein